MFVFISLVVLLIITYLVNQMKRPPNYPPGPLCLPIVGNLPQLKRLTKSLGGQYLALAEMARQYNTNLLGLKLGKENVIAVFSYHLVRSVLTREEYEGRPDNFFMRLRCMGQLSGITCTDGEPWNIRRTFVIRHLRQLGFGKTLMDAMIREEIDRLVPSLEKIGDSDQIGKILAPTILNIIWALGTGSRISTEEPKLNKLLDLLHVRSKAFDMSGGNLGKHPWLRFVAPEKSGYNLILRINSELKSLLMDTIEEHHKTWTDGRDDDLIYSFISEMKQANGHSAEFSNDHLVMTCLDLFIGGAQTTSNTLDFAILLMILNPDVQKKAQIKIDEAFDKSDVIQYADRRKVPYIEAVLLEVERFRPTVAIAGPRRVLRDTTLDGHSIPKNSTILISVHSVHNDKNYWEDPEVFRPERFLDENESFAPSERVLTFGLGRRRCIGEILAKNCLFLIFTEIMRKYNVSLAHGSPTPTNIPQPGITLSPEHYRAQFVQR